MYPHGTPLMPDEVRRSLSSTCLDCIIDYSQASVLEFRSWSLLDSPVEISRWCQLRMHLYLPGLSSYVQCIVI
jgi:hypothetical protein